MRFLALLVALVVVLVGIVGIVVPDRLLSVGQRVLTTGGLYAIAVLRIGIGLVLWLAAPMSRAPRTLRVLGAVTIVSGLATPLFGVERARAVVDWEATQGTALLRAGAALLLGLGVFIASAVRGNLPARR